MIPPCGPDGVSVSDESEAAAIEFALLGLKVNDIIVCGHSECGAMRAIHERRALPHHPHFNGWLKHGLPAYEQLQRLSSPPPGTLAPHNLLSRLNIHTQIEHLISYTVVRERVEAGQLRIHGWWFDIAQADVYAWNPEVQQFRLIDDKEAEWILGRLEEPNS